MKRYSGMLQCGWQEENISGITFKSDDWYKADDMAELARRVLDAFCAYEPFRIMAELSGGKMPKIFDSMFMENLTEELEQIAEK